MIKRWFDLCTIGAAMQGVDLHKVQCYKEWLMEAGCKSFPSCLAVKTSFADISQSRRCASKSSRCPYTPWPEDRKAKRVGLWMQVNLLSGLRGIAFRMWRNAGLTPEEIEEFILKARDEMKNGGIRGYMPL
jgi:hypothetical protein